MCYKLSLAKSELQIKQQLFNSFSLDINKIQDYESYFHRSADTGQNLFIIKGDNLNEVLPATWTLLPEKNIKGLAEGEEMHFEHRLSNIKKDDLFNDELLKDGMQQRRCLILADGFFEHLIINEVAQPVYLYKEHRKLFCFVGVYTQVAKDMYTCSLIVTPVDGENPSQRFFKNQFKMEYLPLIIDPVYIKMWLEAKTTPQQLQTLLNNGFSKDRLNVHAVSDQISDNKAYNKPDAIEAVDCPELNLCSETL